MMCEHEWGWYADTPEEKPTADLFCVQCGAQANVVIAPSTPADAVPEEGEREEWRLFVGRVVEGVCDYLCPPTRWREDDAAYLKVANAIDAIAARGWPLAALPAGEPEPSEGEPSIGEVALATVREYGPGVAARLRSFCPGLRECEPGMCHCRTCTMDEAANLLEMASSAAVPETREAREPERDMPPRRSDWVSALRAFLYTGYERMEGQGVAGRAIQAKAHAKDWAERLAAHPYLTTLASPPTPAEGELREAFVRGYLEGAEDEAGILLAPTEGTANDAFDAWFDARWLATRNREEGDRGE